MPANPEPCLLKCCFARIATALQPSEIAPAVDERREAYALVGARVDALYKLPTADHLTEQIRNDLQTGHEARR